MVKAPPSPSKAVGLGVRRRAQQALDRMPAFEDWGPRAGMLSLALELKLFGATTARELYDWFIADLKAEIANPSPSSVEVLADGTKRYGYGRASKVPNTINPKVKKTHGRASPGSLEARFQPTLRRMALTLSPRHAHGARFFVEPGRAGPSTTGRVWVVAFAFAARCAWADYLPCTGRSA